MLGFSVFLLMGGTVNVRRLWALCLPGSLRGDHLGRRRYTFGGSIGAVFPLLNFALVI